MARTPRRGNSSGRPGSDPPLPRWTNEAIEAVCRRHPEWARALPDGEPAYAVPEVAIEGRALARVFGEDRLEAEREFSRACREHLIVGVWRESTVAYPLLTRTPLRTDDPIVRSYGWDHRQLAALAAAAGRADIAADRLLGVVGWLLTEPAFLDDLGHLRGAYEALPEGARPRFPLGRVLAVDTPGTLGGDPPQVAGFPADLVRFLDRWGLMRLATWDLPDPQGPLLPNPLPAGAPARPAHGVHLFVPVHYPLQGDDDLLRQVREFQRQQAAALGLAPGLGGIAHHAQYAQMFRLLHLDRAVRGRFPGRPPRGLVSALEVAGGAELGISEDSVRRLWKWVRACRRGGRHTVPRLRD